MKPLKSTTTLDIKDNFWIWDDRLLFDERLKRYIISILEQPIFDLVMVSTEEMIRIHLCDYLWEKRI